MQIVFNYFNKDQKITDMFQNMQSFTCNQKHEKIKSPCQFFKTCGYKKKENDDKIITRSQKEVEY